MGQKIFNRKVVLKKMLENTARSLQTGLTVTPQRILHFLEDSWCILLAASDVRSSRAWGIIYSSAAKFKWRLPIAIYNTCSINFQYNIFYPINVRVFFSLFFFCLIKQRFVTTTFSALHWYWSLCRSYFCAPTVPARLLCMQEFLSMHIDKYMGIRDKLYLLGDIRILI